MKTLKYLLGAVYLLTFGGTFGAYGQEFTPGSSFGSNDALNRQQAEGPQPSFTQPQLGQEPTRQGLESGPSFGSDEALERRALPPVPTRPVRPINEPPNGSQVLENSAMDPLGETLNTQ